MNSEIISECGEEKMLLKRLEDLYRTERKKDIATFTSFLNEKEQYITEAFAKKHKASVMFYGGYENAVRKIAGFGIAAGGERFFPISAVTFSYSEKGVELTNRDFLGAAMSLGIERRMLGDIIIAGRGSAVVFCTGAAKQLLLYQMDRVGKNTVRADEGVLFPIPEKQYLILHCVVASLRLDCVVAGITGLNREKTAALIKSKNVQLNYSVCVKNSKILNVGDKITIKGYGKFIFYETEGLTKKENIRIIIKKYN